MSKKKRKRCFVIESDTDDSGSDDQLLVNKKSRKIIESNTEDDSSDGNLHQSHSPIPRSPRSLEDEDGGYGPYQSPIESELNSPTLSIEQEETSKRRQERPINNCFLKDLSSPKSKYVTNFQKNKQELTRRLYRFYNQTVFENQLPEDMEVIWNKRMTKAAGCTCFMGSNEDRYAIIKLSDKVCDSAERLRDTLIHEMCHAACWVIDGKVNAGHGWLWKHYCEEAALAHPELPPITQYHTFQINYTVVYECSGCQSRVGRWRASLDTEKFVCAFCFNNMVLLNHS